MLSKKKSISFLFIYTLLFTTAFPQAPYTIKGKSDTLILSWRWSGLDTLGNPETLSHFAVYRSTNHSPYNLFTTTQDTFITLTFDPHNQGIIDFLVATVDTAQNYSIEAPLDLELFQWGTIPTGTDKTPPSATTRVLIKPKK